MYHDTPLDPGRVDPEDDYTIELATFEKHARLAKRRSVDGPDRDIVFTFDDGHAGNLHAARVLADLGMPGVFFVISQRIGTPGYLSGVDLKAMCRMGHEIGSHSATHPMFTQLDDGRCAEELATSRAEIERMTGAPCTSFAFPGGAFRRKHVQLAKRAGYRHVFTSIEGHRSRPDYFFRFQVRRSTLDNVEDMIARNPAYTWKRYVRSSLSLLSHRTLAARQAT